MEKKRKTHADYDYEHMRKCISLIDDCFRSALIYHPTSQRLWDKLNEKVYNAPLYAKLTQHSKSYLSGYREGLQKWFDEHTIYCVVFDDGTMTPAEWRQKRIDQGFSSDNLPYKEFDGRIKGFFYKDDRSKAFYANAD